MKHKGNWGTLGREKLYLMYSSQNLAGNVKFKARNGKDKNKNNKQ